MKKYIIIALFLILPLSASASLWSFYAQKGELLPSVSERAVIASGCEIEGQYIGTSDQNLALEACLRGNEVFVYDDTVLGLMPDQVSKVLRESITAGTNNASINVSPFVTNQGHRLVMADVGDRLFLRFGSGNSSTWGYCTGITDNTTYYTLTGCDLGLNDYGESLVANTDNINSHSSGEPVVITNQHHWFLNYFPNLKASSTITHPWTFDQFPTIYSSSVIPTSSAQFATKYYVDTVGAGGFSSLNKGLGQKVFGTAPETTGPDVAATGTGALGFYGNQIGVVVSPTANTLTIKTDGLAVATTTAFDWSGVHTFSGAQTKFSNPINTSSTIYSSSSASSTIPMLNVGWIGATSTQATTTVMGNLKVTGNILVDGNSEGNIGRCVIMTTTTNSLTTGAQTITHTLGETPQSIEAWASQNANTTRPSYGVGTTASNEYVLSAGNETSANTALVSGLIYSYSNGTDGQSGTLDSVSATDIVTTITKKGSGTSMAVIFKVCK
jgi:hypothetical protein